MNKRLRRFFLLTAALISWQLAPPVYAESDSGQEQNTLYKLLRGYLLGTEGRYNESAMILGEVGVEEKNHDILASAVKAALQARNIELALQYASAWVAFGGGIEARQTQAELYLISEDFTKAESLLSGLMIEKAQAPVKLYHQLSILVDKRQAIAMGQRLFPEDADGFYYLALLAREGRLLTQASEFINQALAADDTGRLDILFFAGYIAQQSQGDAAPLALMQQYVHNGCANALRHCTLDAVLWAFSNYLHNGEEGEWRERLNAEGADSQTWAVAAGHWYEQWEMPAEARAAYERGGQAFMAQLGLARLAQDEGDIAAALAILQAAAVENSAELVRRETTIAYLLSLQENLPAALARLAEAQKKLPDNFDLMYHQSLYLEQSGEVTAAVAVLRRITELFPHEADGWNALGYVMADHNLELENAKKYIEYALSQKPDDPNIIDSLGWVYYRLGNLASAHLHLKKAVELSHSAEIYAHYGEVLWELGNIGEAKRIWRQAQELDPDNKLLNETINRYNPF